MKYRWVWLKGLLSKRSHYTASGEPKQAYSSADSATRAARAMAMKTFRPFDAYRCWFYCRKWHIGAAVPSQPKENDQ